ncbi:MAG: mycothiol synthase [Arachnia sp.]
MIELSTLTANQRSRVENLLALVSETDGVRPVNESADLVIGGHRSGHFVLATRDDILLGVAVLDDRDTTIQLAVHPQHRRQGHGTALLKAALQQAPNSSVWAFSTQPAAQALTAGLGLKPMRELLKMSRPLGNEAQPVLPEGWSVRAFVAEDDRGVVDTNAAAFVHHPEQGKLTLKEFHDLTQQSWFSSAGLLVATRTESTEVAGFHWTKRHDNGVGEVYVLAVHPQHSGHGLGRALLESGLAHLAGIGCTEVILYVEASEQRVVEMYRSASFVTINIDTSYVS